MTTYAGIREGFVVELFTPLPAWTNIPVETLFHSALFDQWVPVDGVNPPPAYAWRYDGSHFTPPTGESLREMREALMARAERTASMARS